MIMVILSACIVGVVAAVVFYLRQIYSIFSKYGVEKEPSVGNMASEQCLVLEHLVETKLYKNYPEERFIGRFEYTNTDRENLISSYRSNIFIFCTFELKKQVYTNLKNPLCTRSRGSRVSGFCEIFMYFLIWNLRKMHLSCLSMPHSEIGYLDNKIIRSSIIWFPNDVKSRNDLIVLRIFLEIMVFLLWIILIFIALLLYNREIYSRFRRHGVKYFQPLPLLGNLGSILMRKQHITDQLDDLYYKFSGERFVGRFEFTNPVLYIRDLELIKKITVKDFEHFLDHRIMIDEKMDPLFGRNLLSLKGQEWKDMRSTLSPAFTSSKMRLMVPFMVEVSDLMTQSLKAQIKDSGVDYIDVDCVDLTARYANDVIASCAFGLKVDSHSDVNNEFYTIGRETATTGFQRVLVFLGYSAFPLLMRTLGIKLFTDKISNFFRNIILQTMKERELKKILRPDMIHLLMEAKKGKLTYDETRKEVDAGFATVEESLVGQRKVNREWSDDDLVAQAVLFFLAGFDTVSTAMSFLLYELACNPDIQERLVQEIKENDIKTEGKIDFNSVQNMVYLDMVVSEILRRWSPGLGLDRLCVKDYNMGKPNETSKEDYIVRKGESMLIPVWSIHHDPEFYPNPNKFDPERFAEENKRKIKPFTFIPFGLGPRNCIGSRFALCEIKVMVYRLLQQMELSPCAKTQIPAVLSMDTFNLRIKGGNWVRFRTRQ
ncbi:unnamed protein product [Arctia plantaginis]|uniref:unspecific monooxygenase n=1 Tax=Arctia plantaginis TaxID=874455 RepID=A0A8S1B3N4_ARCPL|nr:unnamed protein product [Arctia plantaginis]